MNLRLLSFSSLFCTLCLSVASQAISVGKAPLRSEFVSYDIRESAESRLREKSSFFLPLTSKLEIRKVSDAVTVYLTVIDVPFVWLDREVFVHIEGAWAGCKFYVGDRLVGGAQDSKTPYEFNISPYITNGQNKLIFEVRTDLNGAILESLHTLGNTPAALKEVYIYSQPKLRIEDFDIKAGTAGVLRLDIALANSYNYTEKISVGYDVYAPSGELLYYDKRPVEISGNGRDTVRFAQEIPGASRNHWSAASPKLHRVMLIVWRDGRIVEYVPLKVGVGTCDYKTNLSILQAAVKDNKTTIYNATATGDNTRDAAKIKSDLAALKKKGISVIRVSYPQVCRFYELCDELGMYVVDQANINYGKERLNRSTGGTPSNDLSFLSSYLERVQSMHARVKNHPCIIAWSLGGESGNGYNMYKSYLWLKSADTTRPVIYDDAQDEWNSDL